MISLVRLDSMVIIAWIFDKIKGRTLELTALPGPGLRVDEMNNGLDKVDQH